MTRTPRADFWFSILLTAFGAVVTFESCGDPVLRVTRRFYDRAQQAQARAAEDEDAPLDADRDAARKLVERRASTFRREADPRRRRQKAYALLARNGFAPDVCHEVASSVAEADDDEA